MKLLRSSALLVLLVACIGFMPVSAQNPSKRPMDMDDILAFRSMGAYILSPDGQWLAYRMSPSQGDGEVILRNTSGDKEMKFPVGEGMGGTMAFSEDSAWLAMSTSLTRKEAQAAQRARRPVQNGLTLVKLATGEKTNIAKIRRFAFAGEMAGWIALHRYGADTAGASAPAAAGARGGGGAAPSGDAPRDTRPRGTDLVLRELATGTEMNIGNISEFGFNKSGKLLALVVDAADQAGNGLVIRDMKTGVITPLETDKAFYERMAWTEEGDAIAILKGHDDRAWKERLFTVIGFSALDAGASKKVVYDPEKDKSFPANMSISANRSPQWTEKRDAILFGIAAINKVERKGSDPEEPAGGHPPATPPPAVAAPDTTEKPDLIIWHYKDPRLQSQQQVQESSDKMLNYLSTYRIAENKFIRLADNEVRSVVPGEQGKWAVGTDVRAYELEGNLNGRNYRDVYAVNMITGERKLIKRQLRWSYSSSPDDTKWFYYENRHFYVYDLATGSARNLTSGMSTSFVDVQDDHNVVDPPVNPMGWTSDSASLILSDGWDLWKVPVAGDSPAVNLTINGKKDSIRYRSRIRTDPEEKGIDLSKPQYFSALAEWTKKQGYGLLTPGKPGIKMLTWDDAAYSRLSKAKKADIWIYSRETPQAAPDIFVTNAALENGKKITNLQTEVDPFLWTGGTMLVDFKNDKGERLQASLTLPPNYEKGKQYPMIVYIYERLTQGHNSFPRPSIPGTGFNLAYYVSNGYAVLQPDIKYYVNDPGMSAVWAIVPAVKAAIATGIPDPKRIGLHGHSWGGYQTAFAVTQTDIFAAAVAGAPLTNMISMYSLIYKNSGGTNGAIFESSQGRFTGGPWELWDAYSRNSPVHFAKNVKTPLIILANDKDGAVDFTQGVEYYNTLRRMGKPVVLLEYPGENHGLAKMPNQQDYMVRMKEFFDHYLMNKPSPEWLENGIPLLKMQEHINDRLKQREEQKKKREAAAPKK